MTLIKSDPEGVTGVPTPQELQGRAVNIDRGMVHRQYNGVPIDRISILYPECYLRTVLVDNAKQFVRDMEKHGLQLLTPETEIKVWGPYASRGVYRDPGAPVSEQKGLATGWQMGEDVFEDVCDFVIKAHFLAPRGEIKTDG